MTDLSRVGELASDDALPHASTERCTLASIESDDQVEGLKVLVWRSKTQQDHSLLTAITEIATLPFGLLELTTARNKAATDAGQGKPGNSPPQDAPLYGLPQVKVHPAKWPNANCYTSTLPINI